MTKPLLMPLLLLFYILNGKQLDLLIVWALAAAFFGDVFLMWSEKKLLLLAGIVAFLLPFLGSLLFLISDSLLAFDMFTDKKQTNHAGIMFNYILAQALIVFGVVN
ncbi:lysoplasmalogenase family protein [Neobacillus niacini]|uniref:lysoplasmalogenase family protein n=1 Tax=Neobacillus niacini TaxID=86668 RepID=UPI0028595512|nr:lysoplasmalogenase family protein [Neobacillus niacini]MDR7002024.1 putative membrane protein YhhN [Neobacillus niacini]